MSNYYPSYDDPKPSGGVQLYDTSPSRLPPVKPLPASGPLPHKRSSTSSSGTHYDGMKVEHHEHTVAQSPLGHAPSTSSADMGMPAGSIPTTTLPGPRPYGEHGALIDRQRRPSEIPVIESHPTLLWPRIRHVLREPFAEFMGTFLVIMFGDGVVAQVTLSGNKAGEYQSISWGWGLGVMLGVYASGISGAHLNPAVTLANCVFRAFPWKKFPMYMAAQVLGAMAAAFVVYANYKSAIDAFEGVGVRTVPGSSETATAGIFCTYPQPFMTRTGMFFSEFIASTLLMFCIYSLKDDNNLGAGNLTPLGLFFIIFGIGACFGWETGYAINLARDFGPRLVSYIVGYGPGVWSAGGYYFWIPMVSPFLGCCFGGFLYDLLLFTGESPINTPYLGLYRFVPGWRKWDWAKAEEETLRRWRREKTHV